MRKTARPVVWEGAGAQSPALDLIQYTSFYSQLLTVAAPVPLDIALTMVRN
jgi:hypothetical protein